MDKKRLIEIIEKAANEKAMSLDLSEKQLIELPPEIGKLTFLHYLNLSENMLEKIPPEIRKLYWLEYLDLSNNRLSKLPPEIGKIRRLKTLKIRNNPIQDKIPKSNKLSLWDQINHNEIEKIPREIGNLISLKYLDLNDNLIREIPREIGKLENLTHLNLSNNFIAELPREIGKLVNLTYLNLSNNFITELPREIGKLKNLKFFDLSSNTIQKISKEVKQLKNLESLDLSRNKLQDFPLEILSITSLKHLFLCSNILHKIPPEIGRFSQLKTLELNLNLIQELPSEIGQLSQLRRLTLTSNSLTKLPLEIGKLHLTSITYGDNPWENLPPEVRRKGCKGILDFHRQQLEKGIDRIYEAKLLIVGEGGAGKTTLAKKIEDENYELISTEQSTEGIDIIRWKFPFKDDREFIVNIWDFGGQEIYHATHQFFLTKRSLYILVADSRKEDTDFFYWLNVVDLLSETSPILIVKNEKQDRKREINKRQLRGEFTNLEKILSANLANNRGLSEIKNAIQHYITTLSHIGDELPKTWVKVRKALETNPHNHITLEEYLEICTENGFTRREDALQLSEYLHDLGVCLHFQASEFNAKLVLKWLI